MGVKRKAEFEIHNCSYRNGYVVARVVANQLWFYGTYDTEERAKEVAKMIGENAVWGKIEG